ncbi:MAG: DUF1211 domain-containing protein [Dehalococcoidia bacterium]|nr:DUF1211 domain-containing protein [Dehalococcoidia bacterium]
MRERGASEGRGPARAAGTARLEAFTDGVIVIVLTLLVFELHVPEVGAGGSLVDGLGRLAPKSASFAVSFATVAIARFRPGGSAPPALVNHHHFYERVRHPDLRLLW